MNYIALRYRLSQILCLFLIPRLSFESIASIPKVMFEQFLRFSA